MNYASLNSLWDISQPPPQFPHSSDDDFLAFLHKQFPPADPNDHTVNPQSVQDRRESPQSDDSSPSPPDDTDAASRRQSLHVRANDTEDAPLKRKASSDDMEPGPSSKNQHIGSSHPLQISTSSPPSSVDDSNLAKKLQPSRRKSTGHSQVSPSHRPRPCPLIVATARRISSAEAQGTEQSCAACISRAQGETCQGCKYRMHCPCLTCLISPSWKTRWPHSKPKTKRPRLKTQICVISYLVFSRKTLR